MKLIYYRPQTAFSTIMIVNADGKIVKSFGYRHFNFIVDSKRIEYFKFEKLADNTIVYFGA